MVKVAMGEEDGVESGGVELWPGTDIIMRAPAVPRNFIKSDI